jgi:hypothetical protein
MYDVKPNLIIGFHGCDASVRDHLLNHPDQIIFSKEKYDWLGHGMYFWENNYQRALLWAEDKKRRGRIDKPAVIGAVLFLGYCCDFLDSSYLLILKDYFNLMAGMYEELGWDLPENRDLPHDQYKDKILRDLDCSVMRMGGGKMK